MDVAKIWLTFEWQPKSLLQIDAWKTLFIPENQYAYSRWQPKKLGTEVKGIILLVSQTFYTVSWENIVSLPRPTAYAIHQNVGF